MAEKHIGIRESQYVVLSTAPDVCMVGIVPVPFDSFQDLSYEKSYISNVRARGKSILTVGSVIAGTQSNAGMGIISGTSLDKGDCEILTGVAHIKCKGKAIARYGSLVMMNNGNTIGTLYTQVNPPNGPVPVAKNVSFLEKLTEQEVERQWLQMEAMQQMPDSYEGMGKNFINNQYEFGRQLGEGGMQNGSMEFEEQIAILKLMGADTSLMEKANELNQTTIEEIDVSPPLLEMENETQERGAKLENALEWVLIIKGLTKGGLRALKWLRGGTGVGGVKVVAATATTEAKINEIVIKNINPKLLLSRQSKNEMTGSQVKRLIKDMKANGYNVNEPVDITLVNGKMIIIDGHHRAEAARKAGLENISARVIPVTKEQGDQLLREVAEARTRD